MQSLRFFPVHFLYQVNQHCLHRRDTNSFIVYTTLLEAAVLGNSAEYRWLLILDSPSPETRRICHEAIFTVSSCLRIVSSDVLRMHSLRFFLCTSCIRLISIVFTEKTRIFSKFPPSFRARITLFEAAVLGNSAEYRWLLILPVPLLKRVLLVLVWHHEALTVFGQGLSPGLSVDGE